jgi:hypothetical protein
VREIDPSAQPAQEEEQEETEPVNNEADGSDSLCRTEYCQLVASMHIENDGSITEISSVDLKLKKSTLRSSGTITVAIMQDSYVLTNDTISTNGISTTYTAARAEFSPPIDIKGSSFDIVVVYEGSGIVQASSIVVG